MTCARNPSRTMYQPYNIFEFVDVVEVRFGKVKIKALVVGASN